MEKVFKDIEGDDFNDEIKKYKDQFGSLIKQIREK